MEVDSTGWRIIYNGKVYIIDSNGSAGDILEFEKVKYGNQILGIGDQVNYNPTLNALEGTTTYTSYSASNASADKITVDDVNRVTGFNPKNPRYNQDFFY